MASRNDPQLSWQTVVAAITVVGLLAVAQWTIFQNQFSSFEKAEKNDREQISDIKSSFDKYLSIREHTEYRESIRAIADDMLRRLTVAETMLDDINRTRARRPIEQSTFDAVSKATDDRITLLQSQITDLNRQIAAALIIIDNNAAGTKRNVLPP